MNSLHLLCAHVLNTLPDSLHEREKLLGAVENCLSAKHELRPRVRAVRNAHQRAIVDAVELGSLFRDMEQQP